MTDFKEMTVERDERKAEILRAEFETEQWAHFGQVIHERLTSEAFVIAVNRAGLKGSSVRQVSRMIRAFLMTGAMP